MQRVLLISLLVICMTSCNAFLTSVPISEKLGAYSLAAYCSTNRLYNWSCGETCNRVDALQNLQIISTNTNNLSYIGYNTQESAIVIVVRGTVPWSLTNWFQDLNTFKTDYSGCDSCSVHHGFYLDMQSIFPQLSIQFNVLKSKYPQSKVYLTGHSMGAAIATLLAPQIYKLNGNKPLDAFYTMGSPRVGNAQFSKWFHANNNFAVLSGRITKNRDPVVQVPPLFFPFDFHHIGNEIFYQENSEINQFTQCENPDDKSCSYGMVFTNILDHQSYFNWNWAIEIVACQ